MNVKAEEVRIGNCVEAFGKLIEIDFDHLFNISKGDKDFKPIPLTEEWLEKAGFENKNKIIENIIIRRWILNDKDPNLKVVIIRDMLDKWTLFGYETAWTKDLDYLHQLQNLYFALTGEELTIE